MALIYTDVRGKLWLSAGFLILTEIFLLLPERRTWPIVRFMSLWMGQKERRTTHEHDAGGSDCLL